jgi:hypothetical protein
MKKSIIALFAAATVAAGVNAQEQAGGDSDLAFGAIGAPEIATAVAGVAILGAVINNNRSDSPGGPVIEPPPVEPTCEGDDPLVDGVCVGTTNTLTNSVTVSGTQTVTQTITVPVTFTYSPTVQ